VILVDDAVSREDRDAITTAIDADRTLDWWHWFHRSWLVKDSTDRSATQWREFVHALAPQIEVVILEVTPRDAAYWTHEDSAEWIADTWSHE
jgi:hypothetical protein